MFTLSRSLSPSGLLADHFSRSLNYMSTIFENKNADMSEAEKGLEDGDLAQNVRSTLRWQVSRSTRRTWWMVLAGTLSFAALFMFFHTPSMPRYLSRSDALLDTAMNETLGFQKIFVINVPKQTGRKDRILLAASLTGLKVDIMEAVGLDEVNRDSIGPIPPELNVSAVGDKVFASWRSHMNAVSAIIEQDLGSALILEDDADWDVRIKTQMRDWALTSRQLVQPKKSDPDQYLDPSYFISNTTKYNEFMPKGLNYTEWDYSQPPAAIVEPTTSAYGDLDRWDVLWLGHCGQRFAKPGTECNKTPLGRVLRHDETTIEMQHYKNWLSGYDYRDMFGYQNHTRVTHWSCAQICNTAYGVSNGGAKKLLYENAVRMWKGMSDRMLREICDGADPYAMRPCIGVTPPLFNQYGFEDKKYVNTHNIRLSAQGNLERLSNGERPLKDYWPDAEDLEATVLEA